MESCVQRSPKHRKSTVLFQMQPPSSTIKQQQVTPMFLLIQYWCCKGLVGRPRCQSQSDSVTEQVASHSSFYLQNRSHKGNIFQ